MSKSTKNTALFYTIYQTTNILDGKVYIGKHQTKDINDGYTGSGKYLKHAINKHGIENFIKDVLFIFDNELEMNAKEAEIVNEEFIKRTDTYNICLGGHGGFGYINSNGLKSLTHITSPELYKITKEKGRERVAWLRENDKEWNKKRNTNVSKGMKNYFETHSGSFKGRKHSEEAKQKISKAKANTFKGERNSQYGTMWITDDNVNKKIKSDDVIPIGWRKGTKFVPSIHKGKMFITDGHENKRIFPDQPIPLGWEKGMARKYKKKNSF